MNISFSTQDFGGLDPTIAATTRIKQEMGHLTAEASSGYVSSDYAGLGSQAATALDLTSQISGNAALQSNTDSASAIQSAAQTALGSIETIASQFAANVMTLEGQPQSVGVVSARAQDALQQVASLLDTKVGDIYVFAGQDSRTAPVPDPQNITQSAFYAAIQTAVGGLSANGWSATSQATLAVASPGGTSPFSASLEAGPGQAEADLGGGSRVALAPLANQNSDAVSAGVGTASTGSYMRDLLRGLATIGSLTPAQAGDPNFLPLVQDTVSSLQGAVSAMNTDIGALGGRQDQVSAAKAELGQAATAAQTQLSSVQDADLTQVSAQLSTVQTQLQASFQLIATLSQLSLVKFLPT